jgi:peroxiredoxin Q/BCP
MKELNSLNAVVLGISKDSIEAHKKFIAKYDLPFLLLSDTDGKVSDLYGVIKEKNMYGKKTLGIERSTFLIDESGIIIKAFRKVKVEGHIADIINFINCTHTEGTEIKK